MSHRLALRATSAVALAAALAACASSNASRTDSTASTGASTAASNTAATAATSTTSMSATASTASGDWHPLIDSSLSAWRVYKTQTAPTNWHVANGVLSKSGPVEDIVSKDQYGDFELDWDWMLNPGGNAGVFYRGTEEYDKIYWSAPEYQLLDDARHPDGKNPLTSAAAAYGLYAAPRNVVKPAGEWNSSRLIVQGNHVQHWLNGQKVVEYDLNSPDWTSKVKAAKFHDYPNYGKASRGYLAIQGDHDGALSVRDMRIREIK